MPSDSLPDDYADLAGVSEDAVVARTGRSWSRWVRWLDERNAETLPHADVARLVDADIGDGWWAQTVAVAYERIRGLREPGQRRDGLFEANRTRALPVPAAEAFTWLEDPERRRRWIPDAHEVRGANPPKSVRLDWPDGTRVQLQVDAVGDAKCRVAAQHTRLPDRNVMEARKAYWSGRLDALKALLGQQLRDAPPESTLPP